MNSLYLKKNLKFKQAQVKVPKHKAYGFRAGLQIRERRRVQ
jgi:hypothetical protein